MSGAILAFARGEAPGADWPRFDQNAPHVMVLGESGGVAEWPNWQALPLLTPQARATQTQPATRPRD